MPRLVFVIVLTLSIGVVLIAQAGCSHPARQAVDAGVTRWDITVGVNKFDVVQLDLKKATLRLYWKRPDGVRFANFQALDHWLVTSHQRLLFAANAGIFDPGFTPSGLHIEDGRELVPLNLKAGAGNFYLKPNGVLLIDENGAKVVDATKYAEAARDVRLATQSGPLLLLDGAINTHFAVDSANRQIRSGVGVCSPREIVFAISRQPVTFYEFAAVFKKQLNCSDALYLDGGISQFYDASVKPNDPQGDFAGILAVTQNDGGR